MQRRRYEARSGSADGHAKGRLEYGACTDNVKLELSQPSRMQLRRTQYPRSRQSARGRVALDIHDLWRSMSARLSIS